MNLIYQWSGCVIVNRRCWEEVIVEPLKTPDSVSIDHEGLSPECTLRVVVDGEVVAYNLSRRLVFGLMAQSSKALLEMEPGRWVSPYETETTQEKSA